MSGAQAAPSGDVDEPLGAGHSDGFGELLARRVQDRQSQLVLGLDPDPLRLWPQAAGLAGAAGEAPAAELAARAVEIHCRLVIDAVAEECVAAKLQVACFERLGAPGWAALAQVAAYAGQRQLLVILDAKRGDIEVTAAAYAQAYFGHTPTPFGPASGLGADALTVNPLLGLDSLAPLVQGARAAGSGVFVLVRTSNRGAADVQDLALTDGRSVSERLAEMVTELGQPSVGPAGLADVGAVVGATAPERLQRLRQRMPHAVFLLPGVGAQGGRVENLAPAFSIGPAGGLISVSRGLVGAHQMAGGEAPNAARREAARLRRLAWSMTS
jgi:orotidine-5'-phosphate decarboxylase